MIDLVLAIGLVILAGQWGIVVWTRQWVGRASCRARGAAGPRRSAVLLTRDLLALVGLLEVAVREREDSLGSFHAAGPVLTLPGDAATSSGLAGLAVAAHEVGHALQRRDRHWLHALASGGRVGTSLGALLAVVLLLDGGLVGDRLLVAAGLGAGAVTSLLAVAVVILELDASRRGLRVLLATVDLAAVEADTVRQLLTAAAWTYLAAPVDALLAFVIALASDSATAAARRDVRDA